MFLIYDDLCSNIEIKYKYGYIFDKTFISKFINKIFISKFINNINDLFIQLSRYGYDKIVKLLLKHKQVDPSYNNNYAIRSASVNGYYKIVKLLLKDKRIDKNDQIIKDIINKMKNI